MAMMTFAQGGLLVWMPTFLSRMRGYTLLQANNLFGLIIAADGVVASLAGGWLGDVLLRRTRSAYYLVSAVSMGLGIPVMIVALFNRGPAMVPGIAVAGFLLLLNTAPLNAAIINSVGAHIRATAIAVNLFVIHFLGDALSPWIIGKVSDRSSLEAGFISTVVATALSSAILFYGMKFAPPVGAGIDEHSRATES
jgi:sugar phosphate permease